MTVHAPARPPASARPQLLPGAVTVGCSLPVTVTSLQVTPDAVAAALDGFAALDPAERATLAAVRDPDEADAYLVSHVLMRGLLAQRLQAAPGEVRLARSACAGCQRPHGRPVLAGAPATGPWFSVARTRGPSSGGAGVVVVALADAPVGVDVEARTDHTGEALDDLIACLHPSEQASLRRLPPAGRAAAFLDCWVRKEAYLKATGRGLALGVAAFRVGLGARHGEPDLTDPGPPAWPVESLELPSGVPAAVCVRR